MPRTKLSIVEVRPPQTFGDKGAQKLNFKAKDAEGKENWYITYKTNLFDPIKTSEGKEVEADVDVTEREYDGKTFTDRRVTQLYVGGEALLRKGGGGRTSPEERASIEAQVAFKGTIDLVASQVIGKDHELVKRAIAWAISKLPAVPVEAAPAAPARTRQLESARK